MHAVAIMSLKATGLQLSVCRLPSPKHLPLRQHSNLPNSK